MQNNITNIFKDNKRASCTFEIECTAESFLNKKGELANLMTKSISEILGKNSEPEFATDGGTSDGRFMAKICDQVIEFGLINKSIHKINEHTTVNDIQKLSRIYEDILSNIFNHR